MKYLALDVETTGLDPNLDQLLMASFIIADTEDDQTPVEHLPTLTLTFKHERISFASSAFPIVDALSFMPAYKELMNTESAIPLEFGIQKLHEFLSLHNMVDKKITLAGKNVMAFDIKFLAQMQFDTIQIHYRILEPAMLFTRSSDTVVPDLKTCCERADIPYALTSSHSAWYDASLVIRLLRKGLSKETRYI